jgi:hypothetical protein
MSMTGLRNPSQVTKVPVPENGEATGLVCHFLRSDFSRVRIDIALRGKVVPLRAVFMRTRVGLNNSSISLGVSVNVYVT